MKPVLKPIRQLLEAGLLLVLFGLCRLLPVDAASTLGGRVARAIGPLLPVSRLGLANLRAALPELGEREHRRILAGVWENLGRTFAEYPHLAYLAEHRVAIDGLDHLFALRDDGRTGVCFSGHFANWELLPILATRHGMPLTNIYRAPNNPWVGRILAHARRPNAGRLIPKSQAGVRAAVAAAAAGEHLALLIDQKLNAGVEVPFFGRPAMTAPTLSQLALRFDCPVLPVWMERVGGARFHLVVEPPLPMPRTGERQADIVAGMARVNQVLERWIRRRPDQWLWLHRRWKE